MRIEVTFMNDRQPDDLEKSMIPNERNQQEFDRVMKNAAKKNDSYWDRNNPFLRALLIVLAIIAIVGCAYYIISWILMN